MANLKDITRQIKSVKNTQKTTKAMQLVSSSKLRKAKALSEQSKSYANKITSVLSEIALRISKIQNDTNQNKALVINNSPKIIDIILITSDKGLCGGFNMETIKKGVELNNKFKNKNTEVRLRIVGRKGIDYFSFRGMEIQQKEIGLSAAPTYEKASLFIKNAYNDFKNGKTDKVILIHNGFLNMLTQELKIQNILPIDLTITTNVDLTSMIDIEPEDNEENVLEELINKYIEFNIYYSLIDSLAAEHSARMQAMSSATNNAKEKVDDLTVEFNKARQAAITTELIEIISGVEAQK